MAQYLIPIFEYDPAEHQDESGEDITPTKDEAMGIRKPNTSKSTITKKLVSSPHGHNSQDTRNQDHLMSSPHRTTGTDSPARASSPMYRSYSNIEEPLRKRLKAMSPFGSPSRTYTYDSQQEEEHDTPGERHRAVLMSLFLNEDPDHVPDLFLEHNTPRDLNIELVIDDQGHTALHWAAALARLKTLRQLVERGADIQRANFAGETALMRSVLVTNNYGQQCFSDLLDILFDSINSVDQQKRTVLHHMALTSGIPRRATACAYYMNILIQKLHEKLTDSERSRLLEAKDNNGDTALNIAARLGNRKMMVTLIKAGADRYAANNVGLKPEDFVNDLKVSLW